VVVALEPARQSAIDTLPQIAEALKLARRHGRQVVVWWESKFRQLLGQRETLLHLAGGVEIQPNITVDYDVKVDVVAAFVLSRTGRVSQPKPEPGNDLHLDGEQAMAGADDALAEKPRLESCHLTRGCLSSIPARLAQLVLLKELVLTDNNIARLPERLVLPCLLTLDLRRNRLRSISDEFFSSMLRLTKCHLDNNLLERLPEPSQPMKLQVWTVSANPLCRLPSEAGFGRLPELEEFRFVVPGTSQQCNLAGVLAGDLAGDLKSKEEVCIYLRRFVMWDDEIFNEKKIKDLLRARVQCAFANAKTELAASHMERVDRVLLSFWPSFENHFPFTSTTSLTSLNFNGAGLKSIPKGVGKLVLLKVLDVRRNRLVRLPAELSNCTRLEQLQVEGNPELNTPPSEVVAKGTKKILEYLFDLQNGSRPNFSTNVMFVGGGGTGKTTLRECLLCGREGRSLKEELKMTEGMDVCEWTIPGKGKLKPVNASVWDFAGQDMAQHINPLFFSKRSVFVQVWSARFGIRHAGMDDWLQMLSARVPKSPVIVVATHTDHYPARVNEAHFKRKYPQIVKFVSANGYDGKGVPELKELLLKVAHDQTYMGELVPNSWVSLRHSLVEMRKAKKVLKWEEFQKEAIKCGVGDKKTDKQHGDKGGLLHRPAAIETEEEKADSDGAREPAIRRALEYLHNTAAVINFPTAKLRDIVITQPNFLTQALTQIIVPRHSHLVEAGVLRRSNARKLWQEVLGSTAGSTDDQRKEDLCEQLFLIMWELCLAYPAFSTQNAQESDFFVIPALLPIDAFPAARAEYWEGLERPRLQESLQVTSTPTYEHLWYPDAKASLDDRQKEHIKQSNPLVYCRIKLNWLPQSFFPSLLVSLSSLVKFTSIWLAGAMCSAGTTKALLTVGEDDAIELEVRGPNPDVLVCMVQNVVARLASDTYQGIEFQASVSCPKCVEDKFPQPHLFETELVNRFNKQSKKFMPCSSATQIHDIPVKQILRCAPPQGLASLEDRVRDCIKQHKQLQPLLESISEVVVVIGFHAENSKRRMSKKGKAASGSIDPLEICDDLRAALPEHRVVTWDDWEECQSRGSLPADRVIFLPCLSSEFAKDDGCRRQVVQAKKVQFFDTIPLVVGMPMFYGQGWMKEEVGLILAGELFIDLSRCKHGTDKYAEKLKEAVGRIKKIVSPQGDPEEVFVSYCWANSKLAAAAGHVPPNPSAQAGLDPRAIAQALQDAGVRVWLDVNCLGRGGLFEDIFAGLNAAKVFVWLRH
jgi:Leucine-rich repeat (LRR) protein/GTPase SAR1 family protein